MINGHRHWLLSGGIGSGKTAVRRTLAGSGWHTIDSDSVGHGVLETDGPAFTTVARRWPSVVTDGGIDRAALAAIVFSDKGELRALEELTHPHIFGRIQAGIQEIEGPVVVEIPLLRADLGECWQRIIVDSDDQARLDRLVARGMDEEDALARMAAQPSRGEWLAVADVVVPNRGSLEELATTVSRLLS